MLSETKISSKDQSHHQSSMVDSQDPRDQLIFQLMTEKLLLEQKNTQLSEQKAELERKNEHLNQAREELFDELMKMMSGLHRFHRGVMEALPRFWTARRLKKHLQQLADTHLKAQPPGGAK